MIQLYTPRLALREVNAADEGALHEISRDPEPRRYEGLPFTPQETRGLLDHILASAAKDPRVFYAFSITFPTQERLEGWIKLEMTHLPIREYEIGWVVRRELWGNGYASEAARAVMEFAFTRLHAHRLIAFCHEGNVASYRVMEKLGMQREGLSRETRWIKDAWTNEYLYAILEREYSG